LRGEIKTKVPRILRKRLYGWVHWDSKKRGSFGNEKLITFWIDFILGFINPKN